MKTIIPDLNQLGKKWLESKIQRMKNLLKIAEPDEALYREIMLSLGYPRNKVQFLELALMLSYREIRELKEKDMIEKALLYRGGFSDSLEGLPHKFDASLRMDKSVWNYKKIRPTNFPEKRIIGISFLLSQSINGGLVNFFCERINREIKTIKTPEEAKKIVQSIMNFDGLGKQRKTEMFFNIVFPFTIAYSENREQEKIQFLQRIFELHPPLPENSITRCFRKSFTKEIDYLRVNISAKTYFGIHFCTAMIKNEGQGEKLNEIA